MKTKMKMQVLIKPMEIQWIHSQQEGNKILKTYKESENRKWKSTDDENNFPK